MSLTLTIRTDKPEAEVGLYRDDQQVAYRVWHAHRELSKMILSVIGDELSRQGQSVHDITGIIVFRGPGSFTGLRIGITVANALAHDLGARIVGVENEHEWLERGFARLNAGEDDRLVMPEYGAEAHITPQKK